VAEEPYAVRSLLGWTLLGPTDKIQENVNFSVNFVRLDGNTEKEDDDHQLLRQLEQFWKTDFLDSNADSKTATSIEDKRALAAMKESVKVVDGHYQLSLPWREDPPCLPNNRTLAERRLSCFKRRLASDESLLNKYKTTINDYIDKGYAKRVPEEEIKVKNNPVWYLPHHPVIHPMKPGKVRVVFDCAARYKGNIVK